MPASDRAYPSVWTRPPRKERSTLTREQIVHQALGLLDSEGIDALSMRKLAARLDTTAGSLYWHVANRDELIELVIDEVYDELEVPTAHSASDWRDVTRRLARSIRSVVLRHTWVVSVLDLLVAGYPGPKRNAASVAMLAVFETAGYELPEAERALSTVSGYVLGHAIREASWHNWLTRHGQTQQEWIDESKRAAEEITQQHERLRALLASYEGKSPQTAMDEDFDYGLERVLDGLQARIDPTS